jgi:hypothetical protein
MHFGKITGNFLFVFLIFIVGVSTQCQKKIAADKIPATRLVFGEGGGFTGEIQEFALLEDGKIVTRDKAKPTKPDSGKMAQQPVVEYRILTKIGGDAAKSIFEKAKKLDLSSVKFNEPGNMSKFFNLFDGNAKTNNRIVWGATGKPIRAEIDALHKTLMAFIPQKK